jgi:hypothetical protein
MTATDRARVRAIVERTCAAQGVDIVVPPDVAADIARLVASARVEAGLGAQGLPPQVDGGG